MPRINWCHCTLILRLRRIVERKLLWQSKRWLVGRRIFGKFIFFLELALSALCPRRFPLGSISLKAFVSAMVDLRIVYLIGATIATVNSHTIENLGCWNLVFSVLVSSGLYVSRTLWTTHCFVPHLYRYYQSKNNL